MHRRGSRFPGYRGDLRVPGDGSCDHTADGKGDNDDRSGGVCGDIGHTGMPAPNVVPMPMVAAETSPRSVASVAYSLDPFLGSAITGRSAFVTSSNERSPDKNWIIRLPPRER